MQYLFLKQDRINCYSFFNEISKRTFVYPIYNFGCNRSSYHGLFLILCADRFPVTKHLFSLHFTIQGFQQEMLMGQFDDTFHCWFSAVMFVFAFVFILNTLSILVCSRKRRGDCLWRYVLLVILTNVSVYLRSKVIVSVSHSSKKKDFAKGEVRSDSVNAVCFLRSLHKTILTKYKTFEHWSTWSVWTVFVPFQKKTL